MFRNYIKILVRSLWKSKGYGFLNIFGLAIGITCAALIFLWVEDEKNFDNNHEKKDRLYFVRVNQPYDTYIATFFSSPGPMGPALKADFPAIANTARLTEVPTSSLFSVGEKSVYASGRYADSSLFSMFTLPFEQGNPKTAFSQLHSLVITHKTAIKLFGDDKNVLGRKVSANHSQEYVISGVLKDIPANSSLQFEWLAPFDIWFSQNTYAHNWGNFCLSTFVELKEGSDPVTLNNQLVKYIGQKRQDPKATEQAFLWSMNKWNLYDQFENGKPTGGGKIEYVRLFSVIAWIILFIACINFMNLATARSEQRAKEVGVRKVLGAEKKTLILQFIGESIFMAMAAALFAVLIILLALPAFNTLVQKNLTAGFDQPFHLAALIVVTLFCGIVAGSYPSLYLSSFNPVFVLKGIKMNAGSATAIRKGLVVLQFTVSIILIIGTAIIYRQIQHVKGRNLGFNKENLIRMSLQGDMLQNFAVIRQDLVNTGVVEDAALADHETIYSGNNTSSFTWSGKDPKSNVLISQRLVSPEYIRISGMRVKAGRDFQQTDIVELKDDFVPKPPADHINIIITQSLEKLMGKESAVGKSLRIPAGDNRFLDMRIVGVLEDYIYGNMYGKPDPVVFYCLPQYTTLMYVRIKPTSGPEEALSKIAAVMKKDNPAYPFEYRFVDDQFDQLFLSEMLIGKLSRVFAALAIMISCLGLFGLAAYTAEKRTKEIGIRKVLGATVAGVTILLSKDFLKLVCISCIIAFPVAWWAMKNWLDNYAYRISIHWLIFVIAGAIALLIAFLTISFQAIRSARANPVKSLRTE